jgi:hypothetical protein
MTDEARRREEFRNGLTEREKETFDWVLSRHVWHALRTERVRYVRHQRGLLSAEEAYQLGKDLGAIMAEVLRREEKT